MPDSGEVVLTLSSLSSTENSCAPLALHSAQGRKAEVLVQDLHLGKPDLTQQVELKQQRSWCVFLLDVGEHLVPVAFVLEPGRVLAVPLAHQSPDRRDRTLDQVEDPQQAAGPQRPIEGCEDIPPLLVGPQVVQHRGGQHDVELLVRWRASVSGRCREIAGARNYPAWLPADSAPALGPSRNEPSASRKSSGRSICGRWPQSRMTTRRPHQRMNEPGAAALPRPPAAGYRLYRGVRFSRKACIPSTPSGCATQSTNP